jgi:hypothetical protein
LYDPVVDTDAVSILQLAFGLAFMVATAVITFVACKPGAEEEILGKRSRDGAGNERDDSTWVGIKVVSLMRTP